MFEINSFFREHIVKRFLSKRSRQWPKVRKAHLKIHPNCAACNRGKKLEVHHIVPFSVDRRLELKPTNLITLCGRCHLFLGHLNHWKSHNPTIKADARYMLKKIKSRP